MADRGSIDLGNSGGSSQVDRQSSSARSEELTRMAQNAPENQDSAVVSTQPDQTTGSGDLTVEQVDSYNEAAVKQTYEAADGLRIDLGANAQVDAILVFGDDLLIREEDGSLTLIKGGLSNLPTIVFGTVEIPPESLKASLEAAGVIVPAAGDEGSGSSGGNFGMDPGVIGDPFALRDLLPPEEFDRAFIDYVDEDFDDVDHSPSIGLNNDLISDDDDLPGGIAGGIGDDDPTNLTGVLAHDFGQDGAGAISLLSIGAPDGFSYVVSEDGTVLTVFQGQVAVVSFTVNPETGEYVLQQLSAIKHALGQDENNQAFTFSYQVTDKDGDFVIGTFNLSVDDDTPEAGPNTAVVMDDDDVAGANGNPGGVDDDAPAGASGVLAHNFGADFDGASITFLTTGAPAGFSYQLSGSNLLILQGSVTVITVTLNPATGAYTVTQNAPISHPPGNNENNVQFNLTYQVTDGDGDSVIGTLAINVDDDTPEQVQGGEGGPTVSATVLEDGMSQATGDSSSGNRESGETDADDEASGGVGSLSGLISVGADAPLTISLSTNTTGLPTLYSHGIALTYVVIGNVLTATAGSTVVFTLTVNANGSWNFDLQDQLDHVDNGLNDENFDLVSGAGGASSVPSIDFSSIIVATDADGDSLNGLSAGSFTIAVQDDVPVQETGGEGGPRISATVLEDGMSGQAGGDSSIGNKEAGETDADDEASSAASGSLNNLISAGADDPLTFSLSIDTSSLPTLFSQGIPLTYAVVGNVLTATAGQTTVFTLTVNADGSWSFDLQDQLDHVDNGLNDENFALVTGGEGSVSEIDFSSIIIATDADGDSLEGLSAGSFTIAVQDDVPVQIGGEERPTISATVLEDGMSGQAGGDSSTGNKESGESDNTDEASGGAGSLTGLISVGADEPLTISLAIDTAGLPILFSNGTQLTYTVIGNVLTATAGQTTVFTLTVNPDGSWSFDLQDQLDHVDNGLNDENFALVSGIGGIESVSAIDFSSIIIAADADGDSLEGLSAGSFTIAVQDDVPVQTGGEERPTISATVLEDGMSGQAGGDSSTGNKENGESDSTDEASGSAGALTGLISAGADEPVTTSLSSDTSGLPTLYSHGIALTYAVANGVLTATANGVTVFTLTVNPDGSWSFDLQDQLDHVDNGLNDENFALVSGADGTGSVSAIDFSSLIVATDADGDSLAGLGAGSFTIAVQDDVPVQVGGERPTVSETVLEDGMSGQAGGDSSTGNKEGGETDDDDEASGVAGSLTGLISPGADEPLTISLSSDTSGLPTLYSHGIVLTYAVVNGVLTATAGSTVVFTLTVNADGSWSFDLQDQLDHVDNGQNDENFALVSGIDGAGQVSAIDFSSIIVATDADGDSLVGLGAGSFTISVQDDVPVQIDGEDRPTVSAAVLEDGMSGQAGGDSSTGNKEGGETNADDEASGSAGSLTGLISVGADEPPTISLSSDTSGLPTLYSHGVELTYAVANGVLTASAGSTVVFTLSVDADGSWSFDLQDQLDHVDDGQNDENFALVSGIDGTGQVSAIDFSSIIVATDSDGDSLVGLSAGSFTIAVQDDIPVLTGETSSGAVDEDALTPYGIEDGPGDIDSGAGTVGTIAAGNITALFSSGADEPLTYSLNSVTASLEAQNLSSDGTPLSYSVTSTATGYVVSAVAGAVPVFTYEINSTTGNWTFTLQAKLDHPTLDNLPGDDTENDIVIDFGGIVQASDADGDTVSAGAGNVTVTVDDDTPVAENESYTAQEGKLATVNIVLIIDTSGSMGSGPGSKLELAKAAAINLLSNGDVTFNEIMVVNFANGAAHNTEGGSAWTSVADAISYINGLGSGGATNYEAALDEVMNNWNLGPSPATQTLVYFISDGVPNPPEAGINTPDERAEWESFLASKNVAVSYAIGIDTVVADSDLAPIAWAPGNPDLPPVIIDNAADLAVLLQGSLPGNPSGNVLTNDGFGADHPGYIKSIEIEGTTFTYDPVTHTITVTGAPLGAGDVINPNGMQVTVTTAIGGKLIFNFDANGLNQAGDWDYLAPSTGIDNTASVETLTYTIVDTDGDGDSAVLQITVTPSPIPEIIDGEGDKTVSEAGLPARGLESEGSGEEAAAGADGDQSEAQSGTFVINSFDNLLQITITPDAPDSPVLIPVSQLLTSGVTPITIQTVEGKLVIDGFNSTTGEVHYTYTLEDNQNHSGGSVTDVFSIVATDVNNDSSAPFGLTITIEDDAPTARPDTDSVAEGGTATGNVITDNDPGDAGDTDTGKDTQGADSATVTAVTGFGATTLDSGNFIVVGQYGTLTINPNGSYSYVANNNINNTSPVSDVFNYTLTDSDGDSSPTTLTITVIDGAGPAGGNTLALLVDDQNLSDGSTPAGSDSHAGTLAFTAGSDALTTFAFGSTSSLSATLAWQVVSATQIVGWDGPIGTGTQVVQLDLVGSTITANTGGTVSVTATLLNNYDSHPLFTQDDTFALGSISVVASDQDGSSATGTVNLSVSDDVPNVEIVNPVSANVVEGATLNGTWTLTAGADGVTSASVTVGATTQTLSLASSSNSVVFNLPLGTLTVKADLTWSFVAATGIDNDDATPDTVAFTIAVTDADSDTDSDSQTITVIDGAVPAGGNTLALLVDDQNLSDGSTPAGSDSHAGTLAFTAGSDALTIFAFGSTSSLSATLAWQAVSATQIIGWDGPIGTGTQVVQLDLVGSTIAANTGGTVSVTATLLNNYDSHPLFTQDDTFALGSISVVASDQDGSTATGTVNLSVSDDVPNVDFAGATTVNENGSPVNGTYAFFVGADGLGTGSLSVNVNGAAIQTFTSAQLTDGETIVTSAGTLVLSTPAANGTGTWTFTPAAVTATANVNISITLADADGDSDTDAHAIQVVNVNSPLVIAGAVSGVVEEEQLANGIEDTDDLNGLDTDPSPAITTIVSGSFGPLVTGGIDGTLSFAFASLGAPPPAVQTVSNGALLSGGKPVLFAMDGGNLIGYVNSDGSGSGTFGAGDTKIFTLAITNPATGAYTFTLNAPVDHPLNSVEDAISIKLDGMVTVTDSGGPSPADTNVPLNASITVIDDIPLAQSDFTEVVETNTAKSNVVLMLDTSGSMTSDGDPNTAGTQQRIDLLKQAVQNLFNTGNVNAVFIVTFASSATYHAGPVGGWYTDLNSAMTAVINGLNASGNTNYDAAAAAVMNNYTAPPPGGGKTISIFMSDGQPTVDNGTGTTGISNNGAGGGEETAWINFLASKNFDASYAVGFGGLSNSDVGFLEPLAWAPGETHATYDQDDTSPSAGDTDDAADDPNVLIVTPTSLTQVLQGAVAATANGNVLTDGPVDDRYGADGGRILSIVINNVTYVWDGVNTIDPSTGPNILGTQLTDIATGNGGKLSFNFVTGVWSYIAPVNLGADLPEAFNYVIVDSDGDQSLATLSLLIKDVNSAPNGTSNTVSVAEDGAYAFTASDFGFSDSETPADAFLAVKITSLPAAGTLLLNNVAVIAGATISVADINAGLFTFVPTANASGNNYASFQFAVQDSGGTLNGGVDLDPTPATMTINVMAVNDAPVANIVATSFAVNEQTNLTLASQGINFASVADIDAGSGVLAVTLSVTFGTLTVTAGNSGITGIAGSGSSSVSFNGTLTQINNLLGGVNLGGAEGTIVYQANSDNPPASATLALQVNDNGNTGSGGSLIHSDTATINIALVNDAPANTVPGTQSTPEDTAKVITGLGIADSDAGTGSMTVTLSVTNGILNVVGGTATIANSGTSVVTLTGTVAEINSTLSAANAVTFVPNANFNGSATLTMATNDNGNSGSPGALSDSDNVTINVTAVNDQPVADISNVTYSATEQTNLTLKGTGLSVSDVDGNVSVTVTLSVAFGILNATAGNSSAAVAGNGTGSLTITGTVNQVNSFLGAASTSTLTYNANTDTPPASTTLTLQVNDNGNTGTGGALIGSDTATINIAAVNDAPVANNDTVVTNVGNNAAVVIPEWALLANDTDADGNPLDVAALSVSVGTSGSAVHTAGIGTSGFVTFTDDGGGLGGSNNGSFTYQAFDGSVNSSNATVTIDNAATSTTALSGTGSGDIIIAGSSSTTTSLNGGGGNDILIGNSGAQTLTGGTGADVMFGGGGSDTFTVAAGDSTPVVGGTGGSGTISGYDVILDFDTAQDVLNLPGSPPAVAGSFLSGNGTDSTLTIDGQTVKSHSVANGVISFDDAGSFSTALTLDSREDVAAVVQYLQSNDIGAANNVLAFAATIDGVAHTFIYQQGGTNNTNGTNTLVDLSGVTIGNLNTLIGNGTVAPVALDLDGDGVEFLAIGAGNGALFDMDGDGTLEKTAWVGGDDGILVYDQNGDGIANDGSEIIFTGLHPDAKTDLEGLKLALDDNDDGFLTAEDAAYAKMGVWRDRNNNGRTDAGEFATLAAMGIASLALTSDGKAYSAANGDVQVHGEAVFTYNDGTTGTLADASFAVGASVDANAGTGDPQAQDEDAAAAAAAALVMAAAGQDQSSGDADEDQSAASALLAPDEHDAPATGDPSPSAPPQDDSGSRTQADTPEAAPADTDPEAVMGAALAQLDDARPASDDPPGDAANVDVIVDHTALGDMSSVADFVTGDGAVDLNDLFDTAETTNASSTRTAWAPQADTSPAGDAVEVSASILYNPDHDSDHQQG